MADYSGSPRILHVCDSVIGGTGSYLAELLPHQLGRFGTGNVRLLIPQQHLRFLDPLLIDAGLRIQTFNRPSRLLGLAHLAAVARRTMGAFQPDIVHAHSSGAGVVLRALPRQREAKLVFCPHGWAFDMPASRFKSRMIERIEKLLAARADQIIAISPHEHARALEIGIPADRLRLISNGIDRELPQTLPSVWEDDRLKVLFAGRFDRQKGLDVLLEAVRPLGDRVSVRIVGQSVVSTNRTPLPTEPFVEWYGWRDRTQVTAQMLAADLLVVPSRWEGFGLVAVEAMRLSLPVAVTDVGGLRHIVDDGRAGLIVPPNDPLALRACLESVTRDDLKRLSVAGYQRFLSHFTADRMQREVDELYDSLLAVG